MGADAIIGMRQDIDMDTNGFAYFYLQMYGTAVKLRKSASFAEQYEQAEELLSQQKYNEAEQLFASLRDYKDAKAKTEEAHTAYENWKASVYAAKQIAAENKQNNNRSWICPVCGKENIYFISRCSCGMER